MQRAETPASALVRCHDLARMSAVIISFFAAALLTPSKPPTQCSVSRRDAVLTSSAAALLGSRRGASAAEPAAHYRVALSVLLDPEKKTTGEIVFEVVPEWAPLASERFKELLELGFYRRSRFHRVIPGFIAQFGISTSREQNSAWLCQTCKPLPDEARRQSNKKGTLSFAQASAKNSRQTQVFINLSDNGGLPNFLDSQNFTPFARVVSGMELLPRLHAEGSVSQPKAAYYGEEYLSEVFPKLSVIEDVRLVSSG